ncbi:MAG: hypothetical protein ABJO36_12205 [Litorimonas sp.]
MSENKFLRGDESNMRSEFLDNISDFLNRLRQDTERFENNTKLEGLMEGLSNGDIDFRWNFGGRFKLHKVENSKRPNWMWVRWLLSAPFIYGMILPIVLLDIAVSTYQVICFRLWKIALIKRTEYVVIDRHKLKYLHFWQKINCAFCGYANGVITYARIIAGETERYWCPVKHEHDTVLPHEFYIEFADYGDPSGWDALHNEGISGWGNSDQSGVWGRK